MKMKHYIYGCLTVVLLSGCGTYKHMKQQLYAPYERPEVNTRPALGNRHPRCQRYHKLRQPALAFGLHRQLPARAD